MRAESRNQAIERGLQVSDYVGDPLPKGSWIGTLDGKVWGQSMNLLCYFTTEDGRKFRLSAFRVRSGSKRCPEGVGKWYTARDERFDLAAPGVQVGQKFRLVTGASSTGKPVWESLEPVG
jgi:hypothetical protein